MRPTDRPELGNVEETCPRQPGNVFSETDGRINIGIEITNSLRCLDSATALDDRIENAFCQTMSRTQPDELLFEASSFRRLLDIQRPTISMRLNEPMSELGHFTGEAIISNL